MKLNRTPIAAALCCMALASAPLAFAAGDTTRSSTTNMDRSTSSMGAGHYGSASSMDSQTVRQVQQALADKGHNPGPIDGMMGPRTRAALQSYQRQNNLSGAKGLDQQTLDSLGVQAAASASSGAHGGLDRHERVFDARGFGKRRQRQLRGWRRRQRRRFGRCHERQRQHGRLEGAGSDQQQQRRPGHGERRRIQQPLPDAGVPRRWHGGRHQPLRTRSSSGPSAALRRCALRISAQRFGAALFASAQRFGAPVFT
jgi:peptidoglycan hydrolase-like protein with peptidoglycan-binding domain